MELCVKRDPVVLIVLAMGVALLLAFGFNKARRSESPASAAASTTDRNWSSESDSPGSTGATRTLQSLEGKPVRLSDFRGKAVLLNFWATWCEPCKIEMPWFVEMQKQYGSQGLQIVGVAMDDADTQDIAKFAKDMNIDYPILVGEEKMRDAVASDYGGVGFLPETFFINRNGLVTGKVFGLKSRSDIEDEIKKALGDGPATQAQGATAPASGN